MRKGASVVERGKRVEMLKVGEVFQYKSKSKPNEIHTYMVVDLSTAYSHFISELDLHGFTNAYKRTQRGYVSAINLESGQVRYFDNATVVEPKDAYFEL